MIVPRGEGGLAPAGAEANGAGSGRGGSGGAGRGLGGRAGDLSARLQNMTPEQREQMMQRRRDRGIDPSTSGAATPQGGRGAAPGANAGVNAGGRQAAATAPGTGAATTIDALFGPLPRPVTPGRAWLYTDKQLHPVRLRVGISDGQVSELIEGDLAEGTELVTNISTGNETRPAATQGFPFGQPQRGGFPGGGGGFGGGGNRGGGR